MNTYLALAMSSLFVAGASNLTACAPHEPLEEISAGQRNRIMIDYNKFGEVIWAAWTTIDKPQRPRDQKSAVVESCEQHTVAVPDDYDSLVCFDATGLHYPYGLDSFLATVNPARPHMLLIRDRYSNDYSFGPIAEPEYAPMDDALGPDSNGWINELLPQWGKSFIVEIPDFNDVFAHNALSEWSIHRLNWGFGHKVHVYLESHGLHHTNNGAYIAHYVAGHRDLTQYPNDTEEFYYPTFLPRHNAVLIVAQWACRDAEDLSIRQQSLAELGDFIYTERWRLFNLSQQPDFTTSAAQELGDTIDSLYTWESSNSATLNAYDELETIFDLKLGQLVEIQTAYELELFAGQDRPWVILDQLFDRVRITDDAITSELSDTGCQNYN